MQKLNGRMADFIAGGAVVGGLPLLLFIFIFLQLVRARNAGQPLSGDGLGLAMMSIFAYALALLSLAVAIVYLGYERRYLQRSPKLWHLIALVWILTEVAAPVCYFALF